MHNTSHFLRQTVAASRLFSSFFRNDTPTFYENVSRPSKILFGNNSEHVGVERLLLKQLQKESQSSFKVMMICGGGDNSLSLLCDAADNVSSITSVDANIHQLVLSQLKLAVACSLLSTEEAVGFMGMNNSLENRLEAYHDVLQPLLPKQVSTIINQDLQHEVATGVAHFGLGENCYRYFSNELQQMGFAPTEIWNGRVNLDKLNQVCKEGIGTRQEMAKASLVSSTLPKSVSALYLEAINGELYERACMGLYRLANSIHDCKNHVTAMQILNMYDETCLPEWLQPENRAILRQQKGKLKFVHSPLLEVPVNTDDIKYDLISTSNIFDWSSPKQAARDLDLVAKRYLAPPHGYILVRMGICNLQKVVGKLKSLRPCEKVTPQQLAQDDRVQMLFQRDDSIVALRHASLNDVDCGG